MNIINPIDYYYHELTSKVGELCEIRKRVIWGNTPRKTNVGIIPYIWRYTEHGTKKETMNKIADIIQCIAEISTQHGIDMSECMEERIKEETTNGTSHYTEKGLTVIDEKTGLIWEMGGSKEPINYEDAQKYIETLNNAFIYGHNNWRLPTKKELNTLITKKKQSNGLHISSIFNVTQQYCWTSDTKSENEIWIVEFGFGELHGSCPQDLCYTKAVRDIESTPKKESDLESFCQLFGGYDSCRGSNCSITNICKQQSEYMNKDNDCEGNYQICNKRKIVGCTDAMNCYERYKEAITKIKEV